MACRQRLASAFLNDFSAAGAEFPLTPGPTKTSQTITVTQSAPASAEFGSVFYVEATATSGLTVDITVSGVCFMFNPGEVTILSGTGECTITFAQAGDIDFEAAPTIEETTIAVKLPQTITVTQTPPPTAEFNSSFNVAAVAPGGAVSIGASGACSLSADTVTMTSATGTCVTTFDQPGDSNFLPAPQVTHATGAGKASQVITIVQGAPETATFMKGQRDFPLIATAPGGPVEISASGPCTYSDRTGTLTMKKPGVRQGNICTVTYDQGGNANYYPAPQVVQTTVVQ